MDKGVVNSNGEWQYVSKIINFNNYTIGFKKNGGFKSKEDAEEAQERDMREYERNLAKIKKLTDIRFTFTEYVNYWMEEIYFPMTDTVTKTVVLFAVKHIILPQVSMDVLLGFITADYLNDIIKKCKGTCQSGGEVAQKYIRKMLKDAYNYGFIKNDIRDSLIPVTRHKPNIQVLSIYQFKKLLAEACKHPQAYLEIILAGIMGLRSGEIRGLKFSCCNKTERTIKIEKQITRNYTLALSNDGFEYNSFMEEKDPKSKSSYRILRTPDFVFDLLDERKKENELIMKRRNDYTFRDYVSISHFAKIKGKETTPSNLQRICAAAGVPHCTMHGLRHVAGTLLLESGCSLEDVSKFLGHSNVTTTFDIYIGIADAGDKAREVVGSMDPYQVAVNE